MNGYNRVILIGRLGMDPELKYTAGGSAIARLRLAVSETWRDKEGKSQEKTTWITCKSFGKPAEVIAEYTRKGTPLHIEGKLRIEEWEAKDGSKKSEAVVMIDNFTLLARRERDDDGNNAQSGESAHRNERNAKREERAQAKGPPAKTGPEAALFEDDDIPFD